MKIWLGGLIASASGALTGILGPVVAAPEQFLYGPGATKKLAVVAVVSALSHVFWYLSKSPLPGVQNGSNPRVTE